MTKDLAALKNMEKLYQEQVALNAEYEKLMNKIQHLLLEVDRGELTGMDFVDSLAILTDY